MEELTFWEKIKVLFTNIVAHPAVLLILLLPVLFFILNKKKKNQKLIIIIYALVVLIILFIGNSTLFELFDNMMNGLFMALYFPSFITLFIVELASIIITVLTFTIKLRKENKIINIVSFSIIQSLFVLILTVVKVNKINIYEENALYANKDVLALMQLLMAAFTLQIISLLIIRLINVLSSYLDEKEGKKKKIKHNKIETPVLNLKGYSKLDTKPNNIITPINKNLIKEEILTPKSLDSEIKAEDEVRSYNEQMQKQIEEEEINKQKQIENQKLEEERQKLVTPLNKTFIDENILRPTNLQDEITKEDQIKDEEINKQKQLENQKLEEERQKLVTPLNKTFINENQIKPVELNEEIKKEDQNNMTFNDFKMEFPNETKNFVNQFVEEVKRDPDNLLNNQDVEELSIPKEEPAPKKENVPLISNLEFLNLDKTADILRNIKRVYTL